MLNKRTLSYIAQHSDKSSFLLCIKCTMNQLGGTWFTAIDDRYKTYKYVYNFVSELGKTITEYISG